jgi:branched-chain amino acid transport system substrate-binding protein
MGRIIVGGLVLLSAALGLTACGGSSSTGEAGKGQKLTLGIFTDFSGPNGEFAIIGVAGCVAAQNSINANGGILGHKVSCQRFDAGMDPADAVPAASRMLSSASNLVLVQGLKEEVAAATVPIISAQKILIISTTGDKHFDKNTNPFFYRMVPADAILSSAQAYWAYKSGFKNVAMLYETGSQANAVVEPVQQGLEKLGVHITKILRIAPSQSSYRTEVQALLSSHPEAILTETEPQTATTFFSELLELNNGKMLPLQGDSATTNSSYQEPLVKAIGAKDVEKYVTGTTVAAAAPGPALSEFQHVLLASGSEIPHPELYKGESYTEAFYDTDVVAALAMVAAKSTTPEKYQPFIKKVSGVPGGGRVEVHTFAEGVKELEAGKEIVYVGTAGPVRWDEYHNREGTFQALRWNAAKHENEVVATITPEDLQAALG